MSEIVKIRTRLFEVPLAEVLVDAKHGDHSHFERIASCIIGIVING